MDKTQEALKLALEALNELIPDVHDWYGAKVHRANAAITAIREALAEQPAQQQEPVAVMTVLHLKDRTEIGYGPASAGYDLPTGEYKLYTSQPASKPWQGLTPAHLADCILKGRGNEVTTWKLIESKLKELNT